MNEQTGVSLLITAENKHWSNANYSIIIVDGDRIEFILELSDIGRFSSCTYNSKGKWHCLLLSSKCAQLKMMYFPEAMK